MCNNYLHTSFIVLTLPILGNFSIYTVEIYPTRILFQQLNCIYWINLCLYGHWSKYSLLVPLSHTVKSIFRGYLWDKKKGLSSSCVLCTQCCPCLWIVHSWFALRSFLTFICHFWYFLSTGSELDVKLVSQSSKWEIQSNLPMWPPLLSSHLY
jgi:hypothetical protein